MITAKRALALQALAKRRLQTEELRQRRQDGINHKKQVAWEKKTLIPEVMKGINTAVEVAVKNGKAYAEYHYGSALDCETRDTIKATLEKKGFHVVINTRRWEAETDSPCGSSSEYCVDWSA